MKKRNIMRIAAAAMAMVLTVSSLNMPSVVRAENAASQTQMTSEQEVVYANIYGTSTERSQNFDDNWKFYLGDAADAQVNNFDDSKWRQVNLPHDYSIEQDYSASMEAESAYLPGGTGWYRKSFTLDEALEGKQLRVDFGGVYMNATVWVNGTKLGTHPYGYTPFSFDITDLVKYGEENVIAVKVEHQTPSSRWYSGSGIYRSVKLTVMDEVHVDLYGTDIKTPNLETEKGGTVNMDVTTTVANAGDAAADVVLVHTIYEKGTENSIGTVTTEATSVAAGASADIKATLQANNPKLWDINNPNLYTVVTEVKVGDTVVDTYDTEYGFRYIKFDTNTGFYLNGENVKLKGVCMHHDQGSLGSEAHYRAIERQVEILQEMGCNSIRVTHNPAADELIEICNEKGILVIDELFDGWMYNKNGNNKDYANWFRKEIEDGNNIIGAEDGMTWARFDLQATLNRGKNSPSVIMWSLGNEIQEGAGGSGYHTMATQLIAWAQAENTTQLLTIGSNAVKNYSSEHVDIGNQLTAVGGPSGTNYSNGGSYDSLHRDYPNWFLYGSETASHVNSRGVYDYIGGASQTADKELTSYDYSAVGWGATASSAWYDVITRDFVAGEYVWTGFDYLGEPTPWNGTGSGSVGSWPAPKNSYFGIIDTAGLPKDNYYFYQSQWNDNLTTLHVLPAWNEDVVNTSNSKGVPVVVYSDAAAVELFLNGTSLGKKAFAEKTTAAGYTYQMYEGSDKDGTAHRNMYLTWYVPFAEGTLKAVAYDKNGNVIEDTTGRSVVKTTGNEAKLDANVDRATIAADGKDLAYITIDVTDAEGNIVPDACNNVKVKVEGNGVLVGLDNGKQADHQSFQDDNRNAYNGSMIAIVQSTKEAGSFTVTVESAGLEADTVTVTTEAQASAGSKQVEGFYMSKTYYVKTGNQPQLPEKVTVRYTDGTSEELAVAWNEVTVDQIAQTGSFAVLGTVTAGGRQFAVSVNVNMIDEIGGLLSYSAMTQVGVVPKLPDARQVVMPDGTILSAAFAVDWEEPNEAVYSKAGTVVIPGTANVFGETIYVTATIRVQAQDVKVGDVITAKKINLKQSIEEALQSGSLAAVDDGKTTYDANAIFTNKAFAEKGNTSFEINFGYDTEQRFGEMTVYFASNNDGMSYPKAGSVSLFVSPDGDTWTKLNAEETIGAAKNKVKAYTYSFDAIAAERVKVVVNSEADNSYVGITEIETKTVVGSYTTYGTAKLASVSVNGVALSEAEIAAGTYSIVAPTAAVKATGADNAAVTVLTAYNDVILVIVESEDHTTRNVFEVKANQVVDDNNPEDAGRDYPVASMTAIADSIYGGTGNEGPASHILDGNTSTHWHTNWSTSEATEEKNRWVGVELAEAALIDGIRSLPRQGSSSNGSVTEYKIQYRLTSDEEWKNAATGTWNASDRDWKLVTFEPVEAKYVRIVGVHTYADSGNDAHMSMAEFRVKEVAKGINITDGANNVTVNVPETVEATVVNALNPVEADVVVTAGNKTLTYGRDYIVTYTNNTKAGTATVEVTGIFNYSGTITKTFEIVQAAKAVADIYVATAPEKVVYAAGEAFAPAGLKVLVVYTDGTSEVVAYSEDTAANFTFAPAEALTENDSKVDITYAGKTVALDLSVGLVNATAITLDKETATVNAGETVDLVATVAPANAVNKGVNWSSSDEKVATVANGTVTGIKCGTVTITATNVLGQTATCQVTVVCEHTDTELQNKKDATCQVAGYTGDEVCTVCGEVVKAGEEIPVNKEAHKLGEWEETKAPTCEEPGEEAKKCTNEGCTYAETKEVEAKGHTFSDWKVTTEATCAKAGEKTRTCSVCSKTETEEIAKVEVHTFGEWKESKAPTCVAAGEETRTCSVCNEVEKRPGAAATGKHTWDAGKVTKAPTATQKGVKTYTCTVCKTTKVEAIAAKGAPKKGTKFVVSGATYKISKAGLKGGTVTFVKTTSKAKTIKVKDTVKYEGISYKVTAIDKNAFKNNKSATKIELSKNVTKIGETAFQNCTKLKEIKIKATTLKKSGLAKKAFKGVKKSVKIVVPSSKVKAYKTLFQKNAGLDKKVKVAKK